jgi:hypothetical protein
MPAGHCEDKKRSGSKRVPRLGSTALLGCLQIFASTGQGQTIRGIVVSAVGQLPIAGATIQAQAERGGDRLRATSDSLGLFILTAPRAGLFTLQATRLGYLKHEADTVRLGAGESITIEIRMDPNAVPLEPLVVTARSASWPPGFEARRATGFGKFVTRRDIDSRGASRTTDLLRGLPGVTLTPLRRGSGYALLMRGAGGNCLPAIWVDGLYVSTFPGSNVDDLLPPNVLQGVEVYTSIASAPTQYRTGTCGVVLFWTRHGTAVEGGERRWWKIAIGAGAAAAFILLLR